MSDARDQDVLDMLDDVARAFTQPDPNRVRQLRDSSGATDRAMWTTMAKAGWLSIMVPNHLGGSGLGIEAVSIVARRLGYGAFPEPFVAAGVLTPLLLTACDGARWHERLQAIMAGDLLVAVTWQGDTGALDPMDTGQVRARRNEAQMLLNGTSRFSHVDDADVYIIAPRLEDALAMYWVPKTAAGLNIEKEHRADGFASAVLSLVDVPVPAVDRLPLAPDRNAELLESVLELARTASSAELIGVMDRALELTLDYLRIRKQFDRPIGSFQALQHRAVNMWMQRELSAAALEAAVRVMEDAGSTTAQRAAAASSVKARTAQAARDVCSEALQLHGAIGFTDEYELGIYFNRALTLCPWLGGASEHRRRYTQLVKVKE